MTKIQNVLSVLGSPYEIKRMDGEQVIYRNLGNGYDIEISGLDCPGKFYDVSLYIWQLEPSVTIVEKIHKVNALEDLRRLLDIKVDEYLHKSRQAQNTEE